jgi:hypothetical protein
MTGTVPGNQHCILLEQSYITRSKFVGDLKLMIHLGSYRQPVRNLNRAVADYLKRMVGLSETVSRLPQFQGTSILLCLNSCDLPEANW